MSIFKDSVKRISVWQRILTIRNWQYCCILSGILAALFLLLGMIACGGFPPIPPSWEAERVYEHFHAHRTGTAAGGALMVISGGLFLPWGALLSYKMRRIPSVEPVLCDLVLASTAASVFGFILPGFFLCLTVFRDYGPTLTLFLSDIFWLLIIGQWPTLWIQSWTLAWAILSDQSPEPVFSKYLGIWNVITPFVLAFAAGIHTKYHGVWAWNGALGFWCPFAFFGIQMGMEILCILKNIKRETTS